MPGVTPYPLSISYRLFALAFCGLLSASAFGKHIIGGEVTYACLGEPSPGIREYEIRFFLYRDSQSGGAEFDSAPGAPRFEYTIYDGDVVYDTYELQGGDLRVEDYPTNEADPCAPKKPPQQFESGFYRTTVRLPVTNRVYTIAYQRCCRNVAISNVVSPGDIGSTYMVEITPTAQRVCNSSPEFNSLAPLIICTEDLLIFDQSATDSDGDDLVYRVCNPYVGGGRDQGAGVNGFSGILPNPESPPPYTDVVFQSPFTADNPFPADPQFQIDPSTGELRVRPLERGLYLVCVSVEEYRNGELLSTVRRDFQFVVVECESLIQANLDSPAEADSIAFDPQFDRAFIQFCGTKDISLLNTSTDRNFIQAIEWTIPGTVQGEFVSRDEFVEATFPEFGVYPARLTVNPGGLCPDTLDFRVRVTPPTTPEFTFAYDTCDFGPVTFTNLSSTEADSIIGYRWDFGIGESSIEPSPVFQFDRAGDRTVELTVTDNFGCKETATVPLSYFPVPTELDAFFEGDRSCAPAEIGFRQGTTVLTDEYEVLWDFGNGDTSQMLEPDYSFAEPGSYNIYFSALSPFGCFVDTQLSAALEILPSPEAGFTIDDSVKSILDPEFSFTDQSVGAVSWQWFFDEYGTSREEDPVFSFPDTGLFTVDLIVSHLNGCLDSTSQQLRIEPFQTYFLPNAFTPNGDGDNEVFVGVGYLELISDFEMRIYDRWGDEVFITNEPTEGWDGSNDRNGGVGLPGVYLYVVDYADGDGENVHLTGTVTLVR